MGNLHGTKVIPLNVGDSYAACFVGVGELDMGPGHIPGA